MLVIFLLIASATLIFKGWIISVFWGWFIVPTFELPSLDVVPAIGLSLILTILTKEYASTDGVAYDIIDHIDNELIRVVVLIVALILGWIAHLFM